MKFSSFYKGEMVKLIKRLLLLTVLFVFCLSSIVSAGTMEDLLFNSISSNNKKMFKAAIDNGADVNAYYGKYDERTPLGFAVGQDNLDFVNELIAKGADVNRNSLHTMLGAVPPLSIAVRGDNLKIAQTLINAGADVNREGGNNDNTPLITAVNTAHINLNMISVLLNSNGINVNKSNKYGMTPLMANACYNSFVATDKAKRIAIAKVLLDRGADPNKKNNDMRTALDFAIYEKFTEMIELLLPVTAVKK